MNKYYTPTIEEFHLGFEFEEKGIDGKWYKSKESEDIWSILAEYENDPNFSLSDFRVKYLDREDIEECGWEYNEKYKAYNIQKSDDYGYSLEYDTFWNKWVIDYRGEVYFIGKIKNKSELVKIMEMLGMEYMTKMNKPKLEVRKWYMWDDNEADVLVYITKITKYEIWGYGFNSHGDWTDDAVFYGGKENVKDAHNHLIEAPKEKVKETLVKEAKRRGFVDGAKFKGLGDENREIRTFGLGDYDDVGEEFWFDGLNYMHSTCGDAAGIVCSDSIIFKYGVWAEIYDVPIISEGEKYSYAGQTIIFKDGKVVVEAN